MYVCIYQYYIYLTVLSDITCMERWFLSERKNRVVQQIILEYSKLPQSQSLATNDTKRVKKKNPKNYSTEIMW